MRHAFAGRGGLAKDSALIEDLLTRLSMGLPWRLHYAEARTTDFARPEASISTSKQCQPSNIA
jgi:hypothetical protein